MHMIWELGNGNKDFIKLKKNQFDKTIDKCLTE